MLCCTVLSLDECETNWSALHQDAIQLNQFFHNNNSLDIILAKIISHFIKDLFCFLNLLNFSGKKHKTTIIIQIFPGMKLEINKNFMARYKI